MTTQNSQISAILGLLLAVSLILCAGLTGAISVMGTKITRLSAERDHMLAQRIAVLQVENVIRASQPRRNAIEIRGYAEMIVDAATEFRKDPLVVARVALAESDLNPKAIGDGGWAIGVMQVHTRWWVGVVPFVKSANDLRDARTNIRAGAWILRHYADKCGGDVEAYLACYNGGEKPNQQARAYATRVAGNLNRGAH